MAATREPVKAPWGWRRVDNVRVVNTGFRQPLTAFTNTTQFFQSRHTGVWQLCSDTHNIFLWENSTYDCFGCLYTLCEKKPKLLATTSFKITIKMSVKNTFSCVKALQQQHVRHTRDPSCHNTTSDLAAWRIDVMCSAALWSAPTHTRTAGKHRCVFLFHRCFTATTTHLQL